MRGARALAAIASGCAPAEPGSGVRHANAHPNLDWRTKGDGGTLSRLSPARPLLDRRVAA